MTIDPGDYKFTELEQLDDDGISLELKGGLSNNEKKDDAVVPHEEGKKLQ